MGRAPLAAALLLLAACTPGSAARPDLPPDLVWTAAAGGGHDAWSVRTGARAAHLGPGALAFLLTSGGDLGEAYLVAGGAVLRLQGGPPFAAQPAASFVETGAAEEAVLVPAPDLRDFTGAQTVLVVRRGDGRLEGFQNGHPIWTGSSPAGELRAGGDRALVADPAGGWQMLDPATGASAGGCPADLGAGMRLACGPPAQVEWGSGAPCRWDRADVQECFTAAVGWSGLALRGPAGTPVRPGPGVWALSRGGDLLFGEAKGRLVVERARDHALLAGYPLPAGEGQIEFTAGA